MDAPLNKLDSQMSIIYFELENSLQICINRSLCTV